MVSGTFKRGMKLTPSGLGKPIAVHSPILFFAQDREIADTAEAGDIIGIPNHGTLAGGRHAVANATMCASPACPISRRKSCAACMLRDPTKTKQLRKALDDLSEEGVIQVFYPEIGAQWIVGVVGQLQLEVLISRLEAEYKVEAVLEPAPFDTARWLKGDEATLRGIRSSSTAPTSRATATATWCSWPSRPGTSAISRNGIPRLPSARPRSGDRPFNRNGKIGLTALR